MTRRTTVNIGTSELGYRVVGEGPDLVFIHGWPLHRETWRNVVRHLDGYTCHLLDLPGCGRSSRTAPDQPISLATHPDAVVAAIEELGLDRVALVGHDSGGMIARYAAAKIPDRMSALILTGTEIPHHHPKLITRLQLAGRLPGSVAITRWLVNSPRLARSNHLLGGLFHDRNLIEGDFRVNVLDGLADHAGVKRQMELLATYRPALVDGLEAIHAEITCPTLLIWGAQDAFFPLSKARAMADQFGGPTRFETIERARLLPHEEHPERFARLCAEFLTANATV